MNYYYCVFKKEKEGLFFTAIVLAEKFSQVQSVIETNLNTDICDIMSIDKIQINEI